MKAEKSISNDPQSISCRRVYIVEPRENLLKHLTNVLRSDIAEYFDEPVVVMTKKVDFERHLEGWQKGTLNAAKKTFIMENLIGDFCPFNDDQDMHTVLGTGTYVEIFDQWFRIKDVEYFEIEIDWEKDV